MLLALLLAVAPAQSNVIIWTGSADASDARTRLEAWPKDEATWSRRVKLAEGFPRLVKSEELPGLKPGFHVVVLGFCNAEQVRPRTRTLRDLYPATYWRPLTTPQSDACPEVYCADTDAMAAVPGGVFLEGEDRHPKELGAFEVDRLEVWGGAYDTCVRLKACSPAEPRAPFSRAPALVTYKQAWEYCGFQGKRVVRSDEWEKAARGTDGRRFPWGARTPDCTMGNPSSCGAPSTVGTFPGWPSPYGVLDLFGNASEWVDGAVVVKAGVKEFPTRGDPDGPNDFAAWRSSSAPADAPHGFRCARMCTWKPGTELPKLPAPVDTAIPSLPEHAGVSDPRLRELLEQFRADRQKELGAGALVDWPNKTVQKWNWLDGWIRERVGDTCREGPLRFEFTTGETARLEPMASVGAIACCSKHCPPPTPVELVLRFFEAYEKHDVSALSALIPPKGLTFRQRINDDPIETTLLERDAFQQLGRLDAWEAVDFSCKDVPKGGVQCHVTGATVTLKAIKGKLFVTDIFEAISEGC